MSMKLPEGDIHLQLMLGNFIPQLTVLLSRKAYFELDEIPDKLKFAPDYYMFMGITANYLAITVNESTTNYRIHNKNWTKRQLLERVEEPIEVVCKYYEKLSVDKKKIFFKSFKRRISERIIVLFFNFRFRDFYILTKKYSNLTDVSIYGLIYIFQELFRKRVKHNFH